MSTTQLSEPITLRVPKDVLAEVEEVARATERSRSWVIVRALKAYLAAEGHDVLAVAEGRVQIERGDAFELEAVLDEEDRQAAGSAAT